MSHSISTRATTGRVLAMAIAGILAVFAWLIASPLPVAAEGNNGTVKIHEGDTENEPIEPNDPKVCTFHVHAWNFDEDQEISISIVGHGGPNAGADSFSATITTGTSGEHGWEGRTDLISLSDGMYKLTVDTGNGTGTQDKHKVFKVDCPDQPGGETADVPLVKVDQAGAGRAGAVFTLTGITDPAFSATATTTAGGSAMFSGLVPGQYSLVETTAPAGCTGVVGTITVTVATDGSVSFGTLPAGVTLVDGVLRIVNTCGGGVSANGDLPLLKVDANGSGRAGAVFTLTGVSDASFSATATTIAGGTAAFADLVAGSYLLAETTAPANCTGITGSIAVTVGTDGTVSVGTLPAGVTFTNGTLRVVNNCEQDGELPGGGAPSQPTVRQGTMAGALPNTAVAVADPAAPIAAVGLVVLAAAAAVAAARLTGVPRR